MSEVLLGPSWLIDDLVRVEGVLTSSAGASSQPLVHDAALHLINAGGKRLRPALVVICSRSGTPGRASSDFAAAAVELVHLATLYHDDVIDQTDVRRGVPTAHVLWGTETAVLVGDYLFACGCGLGAEAGGDVPGILARAIAQVCEGQIVETAALGNPERTVDEYLDTIRLKTASLFGAACELGATTAGASPATAAALRNYGENLGLAFQIVDDLLDLVGDPEITGKQLGTDLAQGVFTAPVLLGSARDAGLVELLRVEAPRLQEVLPALRTTGAIDEALDLAGSFATRARGALDGLGEDEWVNVLHDVVQGVLAQVPETRAA